MASLDDFSHSIRIHTANSWVTQSNEPHSLEFGICIICGACSGDIRNCRSSALWVRIEAECSLNSSEKRFQRFSNEQLTMLQAQLKTIIELVWNAFYYSTPLNFDWTLNLNHSTRLGWFNFIRIIATDYCVSKKNIWIDGEIESQIRALITFPEKVLNQFP